MPIFEYQCQACGKTSEFLEKADSRDKHVCSHCGSAKMTRQLSSFAVGRAGCSDSKSCGGCGNFTCPHSE
jgi:putative FmdB family regulatory protein